MQTLKSKKMSGINLWKYYFSIQILDSLATILSSYWKKKKERFVELFSVLKKKVDNIYLATSANHNYIASIRNLKLKVYFTSHLRLPQVLPQKKIKLFLEDCEKLYFKLLSHTPKPYIEQE